MHVVGNYSYIKAKDARRGELIRFEMRNAMAVGIVVEDSDHGELLVATLSGQHQNRSFLTRIYAETSCLSHGLDWVIDPVIGAESYPYPHRVDKRPGLLALSDDGWLLSVATGPHDAAEPFRILWLNFGSFELEYRHLHRFAAFSHWSISTSADDRARPGNTPLFEMKVDEI